LQAALNVMAETAGAKVEADYWRYKASLTHD